MSPTPDIAGNDRTLQADPSHDRLYFGGITGLVDCIVNMSSLPGTFLVIEIERYSELAIVLDEGFLARVENELWQLLDAQVDGRASVFGIDAGEFGILWTRALPRSECEAVARGLLNGLRGMSLCRHSGLQLTPRIGIVTGWQGIARPQEWVHCAYLALKTNQRPFAGFALYQPEMADGLTRKWELRRDLAGALDRREFVLHYQPRLDLKRDSCTGVEALIRWKDPRGALVSPDEFMPLLENSGVIVELTLWVLNQSAVELSEWLEQDPDRVLAINVSPRALLDPLFVTLVTELIQQENLDPSQLMLEVTEGSAWEHRSSTLDSLGQLRGLGVGVSIDDFGTGHSTLEYLRLMPADEVKIDRSFTQNMLTSATDHLLVQQVIDLSHQLGMTVVAEGTESDAQVEELRRMGCDFAQGYSVARPMQQRDLMSWKLSTSAEGVPQT
ncbi:MAG: EAL domain-containing protein [Xanthomonadales bacterium]|nr:EAL domain-containing protein [Xanthomonadales bacterium]